jgi:carbon monoxide dehydrogenase subunit G
MQLTSSYTFAAPPARVWDVLMDTAAIAGCVPGCQELTPIGDDRFRAKMAVVVAAVTGNFDAIIELADKTPPAGYTLRVDGQSRAGFVKGSTRVALVDVDGNTRIDVNADVQVGGAVARVGQRLLESVGKAMMDRFFACLQRKLPRNNGETGHGDT